ncbi:phosphoenolpyruvate--protein phosphotransferase [Marinagarivorans algicola]|uniref:phosphoenolpyruvate--protein phosphotransferase n=1 Tax=Marinagarivorans algicola TaxID=1513270 RepID=UPI0006B88FC4|nr:phosphoenolpyruvate--protein phosphotransferase [Marinagarivorans algicola]
MQTNELTLYAPISGLIVPLEQVPDEVFAKKMVGDGISIDPTDSSLVAPCDGTVLQVHRARHAVTLQSPQGVEILIHIGIDTVGLKGVGFSAHVQEGDSVSAGDKLLSFDADFVATQATSLLTQILITNDERVAGMQYSQGIAQAGDTALLNLQLTEASQKSTASNGATITGPEIIIPNSQGLHARPSATLAGHAKTFKATIHLHKTTQAHNTVQPANAKSVVALMGLELDLHDRVYLTATGDDAEPAIKALSTLINEGSGEDCLPINKEETTNSSTAKNTAPRQAPIDRSPINDTQALPVNGELHGVCASPGLVAGKIWQLVRTTLTIDEQGKNTQWELSQLDAALKQAQKDLTHLAQTADSEAQKGIFAAHSELLTDPELLEHAQGHIAQGKSAAWAWQQAFEAQATLLSQLKNALLAARATDMRDLGQRVLTLLAGDEQADNTIPDNVILIADDLTPSDTANLDPQRILGFCTATGGASSHVAIIARALNIPAIAGIDKRALQLPNDTQVMLRADTGLLQIAPAQEQIDTLMAEQKADNILNKAALSAAQKPAITQCGKTIEVVCNVGNIKDVNGAQALGAEGVGLLRSEFLFMQRANAPTEDEQTLAYSQVANAFGKGQNIIIRTLDVGGDKPLSYLPLPKEDNPFLGVRGIRVSLAHPEVFRTQLRAILRASHDCIANVHIMFPMITTLEDLRSAKAMLEQERIALNVAPIPVGIMVEVPSVAMLAEQFAREADFFSVGTNDLTQYTLAVDRGHPDLAKTADPLNPAVLAMIGRAVEGAHKHNTWVGVCGGIASDPLAVPILLGLGVDELSGSLPSLPRVKAAIRDQTLEQCQDLAQQALLASTADDVRELLQKHKHPAPNA